MIQTKSTAPLNGKSSFNLIEEPLALTRELLSTFFSKQNVSVETAFGKNYDLKRANKLFREFAKGERLAIPEIKVLSADQLGATNGAYAASEKTIYMNQGFLEQNRKDPLTVAAVLLEEIGHYIDDRINRTQIGRAHV